MTDNEGCDQKTMNPISKTKNAPAAQYSPVFLRLSLFGAKHRHHCMCKNNKRGKTNVPLQ